VEGQENGDGTWHILRFIKAEVRKGEQSPTLGSLYNPLSYHDPLHHLIWLDGPLDLAMSNLSSKELFLIIIQSLPIINHEQEFIYYYM
jgi:hypothetical protein